jgi:hypothetical protein
MPDGLRLDVLSSPDASGLMAQMRLLTDLTKPVLPVTDQLLGDERVC